METVSKPFNFKLVLTRANRWLSVYKIYFIFELLENKGFNKKVSYVHRSKK